MKMRMKYRELIGTVNAIGAIYDREKKREEQNGHGALKGSVLLCLSRNNRTLIKEYMENFKPELERIQKEYPEGEEQNRLIEELLDFEVEVPIRKVSEQEVVNLEGLNYEDVEVLMFMIEE